jgi:prevent-host-death family protein
MKVIPLTEAKARLSHYARMCRKQPVIVTVNGSPAFQMVPVDEDDDLIDQLLEHNSAFRQLLQARVKEPRLNAAEAAKRL